MKKNIVGFNTSLFSWAFAPQCDSCGMINEAEKKNRPMYFKGTLFGGSPHRRGDLALCGECENKLSELVKSVTTEIHRLRGVN